MPDEKLISDWPLLLHYLMVFCQQCWRIDLFSAMNAHSIELGCTPGTFGCTQSDATYEATQFCEKKCYLTKINVDNH